MRALIKTFTYLIIDTLTHSIIILIAGHMFGYDMSIPEAGILGIIIEIVETIAYYLHEILWEKIR